MWDTWTFAEQLIFALGMTVIITSALALFAWWSDRTLEKMRRDRRRSRRQAVVKPNNLYW